MNYCSNCGAIFPPEAKFCMHCAAPRPAPIVPGAAPLPVAPVPVRQSLMHAPVAPSAPRPKANPWLIWLVGTLLISVIGGIAAFAIPAYMVYSNHSNSAQQGQPTQPFILQGDGSNSSPFLLTSGITTPFLLNKPIISYTANLKTTEPQLTLVSIQVQDDLVTMTLHASTFPEPLLLYPTYLHDDETREEVYATNIPGNPDTLSTTTILKFPIHTHKGDQSYLSVGLRTTANESPHLHFDYMYLNFKLV